MLKKFFLTEVLNLGTCTFKLCPLRPYGVEASWKKVSGPTRSFLVNVNESGLASLDYHTEYDDNYNDDADDDFGDLEGTAPKMTFTEAPVQNYMTIGCTAAKISPVRKKLIQQI